MMKDEWPTDEKGYYIPTKYGALVAAISAAAVGEAMVVAGLPAHAIWGAVGAFEAALAAKAMYSRLDRDY